MDETKTITIECDCYRQFAEFQVNLGMGTQFSGSTGIRDPENPGGFLRFNQKIPGRFRLKSSGFSASVISRLNLKNMRAVSPVFSGCPVSLEPEKLSY